MALQNLTSSLIFARFVNFEIEIFKQHIVNN